MRSTPMERVREICVAEGIAELAIFGSFLRDDFKPDSDVDVLITFAPEVQPTFETVFRIESKLSETFGRPVDVVLRRSLERSRNARRRDAILGSAEVVYAA